MSDELVKLFNKIRALPDLEKAELKTTFKDYRFDISWIDPETQIICDKCNRTLNKTRKGEIPRHKCQ